MHASVQNVISAAAHVARPPEWLRQSVLKSSAPQQSTNQAREPRVDRLWMFSHGEVPRMEAIGRKRWAIAEGYIPSESSYADRALVSHETACILNAGDRDAHVAITIFFVNREPVGPYQVTVPARRTLHLRFNDLEDPKPVPRDTDFASVFESDVPIVLQHTRLDSRRAEVSLMSTIAFAES
jgi:hypothetical protein